tara:strand:+ start:1261 stop:1695 length:435 start_codon:yes stop_codon:yes gene_type:complete
MENDNNNDTKFDLVLHSENSNIIEEFKRKGNALLKKNNFLNDLSEIMKDKKFKVFYEKYFNTMDDIKTTVIYMKLYKLFKDKYSDLSQKELEDNINVYLLHHVMTNSDLRTKLIESTIAHLEDNRVPIIPNNSKILNNKKNLKY